MQRLLRVSSRKKQTTSDFLLTANSGKSDLYHYLRNLPVQATITFASPCDIGSADQICFGTVPKDDSVTTRGEGSNAVTALIRWSARVLGVLMASFLMFMFFGYFLEGRGPTADSLEPFAAFGLALMGVYALAMFMALKWERTGSVLGAIVLVCFFIIMFLGLLPGNVAAGFSAKGVLNPVFLALWLPILLYLLCWGLEKKMKT